MIYGSTSRNGKNAADVAVIRSGATQSERIFVIRGLGPDFRLGNLIYHYVEVHHYKPPNELLEALREGPKPPDRHSTLGNLKRSDFSGEKLLFE